MIREIITYFAKFPLRAGVMDNFSQSSGKEPGYDDWKAEMEALQEPLIPAIREFVFSTDETVLQQKLRNMNGYFLLVEYGSATADASATIAVERQINLSVTVGHPFIKNNIDIMEETLIMDQCFNYLMMIQQQMTDDNDIFCHGKRFDADSYDASPVEPVLLYGNLGWTLSFKKNENPE